MMNTKATVSEKKFRITGDWTAWSKLLKTKYSQLTDTDLILEPGRDEELLNRLQRRLARNRDGVIEILKALETPPPASPPTMKIAH